MKSFRFVSFSATLLLAWGAFAVQGSMQQPGQMSQQPGATSPGAQQPGGMPPSAAQQPGNMPPSAAPQTPPSAQTPQSEPSQTPMRSGAPSIDDQVATLTQRLNLTSDQQTKIKSILEDQHQQATTVIADPATSRDDKMQKMLGLRQATITKVRSALSSDDQKQKFDSMIQAQNERLREGAQPQSSSPSPQSNPTPK